MTMEHARRAPLPVLAALLLSACAPLVEAGPAFDMPVSLQRTARLGRIFMSSDWLRSREDFADTFSDEVEEELQRCMTGTEPLDVRIHLDDLERADRVGTLLNGHGKHRLSGIVEFVDARRRGAVVGRMPVSAVVEESGALSALFADRQMMMSEGFGRAICETAFGRNPRQAGPMNATND